MLRVVYKWHRLCVRGARADACAQHNDACASQHDIRCGAEHDAGHNGGRADNEHNDAYASQHDGGTCARYNERTHCYQCSAKPLLVCVQYDVCARQRCSPTAVSSCVRCTVRGFWRARRY